MPDERSSRERARDELQAGRPAAFFGTLAQLLEVAGEAGLAPSGLQVHGTVIPMTASPQHDLDRIDSGSKKPPRDCESPGAGTEERGSDAQQSLRPLPAVSEVARDP